MTLTSDVPEAADLPDYVTGAGYAAPIGHMRTEVLVYAPEGGLVTDTRASKGEERLRAFRHAGLHAVSREVALAPGESVTLEYDLSVPRETDGRVRLRMTPGPGIDRFVSSAFPCAR